MHGSAVFGKVAFPLARGACFPKKYIFYAVKRACLKKCAFRVRRLAKSAPGECIWPSLLLKISVSRETSPTFRFVRTQGCLLVVLSTTSCCTLKIGVSRETSRFFAFFDLPFSCVFLLMMRCMWDVFSVLESTKMAYVCNFRAFSHLRWTMFRVLHDMLLFVSRIRKVEDVSHET